MRGDKNQGPHAQIWHTDTHTHTVAQTHKQFETNLTHASTNGSYLREVKLRAGQVFLFDPHGDYCYCYYCYHYYSVHTAAGGCRRAGGARVIEGSEKLQYREKREGLAMIVYKTFISC